MTDHCETPSERARRHVQATRRLAVAVRTRRKRLGVTQQALARMAGCGLVFIYNIEQGKPSLRLDKLLAVLGVLGLELTIAPGQSAIRVVDSDPARG
jgi:HTH-type transcriptional regulator / antitoxin HipB